jgi:hypothetical protein
VTLTTHDRTFDASGARVLADSSATVSGRATKPFMTLAPDSLARGGYVTRDATGGQTYWAPDAEVLLSESFLRTHCLELAPAAQEKLIGVAFRPMQARDRLVDVSGVLWLDRANAELRSLEFSYANAPGVVAATNPGGTADFLRLAEGRWIVDRWSIRYPVIETRTTNQPVVPGVARSTSSSERVNSIKTTGAEVLAVRRGRDTVWSRGKVAALVRVEDSATQRPLVGALVGLTSSGSAVATDSLGVVRLTGLVPGSTTLRVTSRAVAQNADEPRLVQVRIPDENDAVIEVRISSVAAELAARCGNGAQKWNEGMMVARNAVPGIADLMATVRTPFVQMGRADTVWREQRLPFARDERGRAFLCGVAREASIEVGQSGPVRFAPGESVLFISVP